ncbi:MAG: hypothetical protein LBR74_06660 [Eubacterium sp.]|jgi:hypothetical protein|nr:hypothetical protein [Eubacterium sp.]
MIQNIIGGICKRLNEAFGDDYGIYTEDMEQDLNAPGFSVRLVNLKSKDEMDGRIFLENQFCIRYYPKSADKPQAERYDIQEKLLLALRYITIYYSRDEEGAILEDGALSGSETQYEECLLRGIKMSCEYNDIEKSGARDLCFFVNYNIYVAASEEKTMMFSLETRDTIK